LLDDWVESLSEYFDWVEQVVVAHGGYFPDDTLFVEPVVDRWGEVRAHRFPLQRVRFWADGSILAWRMYVTEALVVTDYSFHYMTGEHGRQIWRKDNVHGGGRRPHLHIPPQHRRHRRFGEVDLEEALQEVTDYLVDGTLPAPLRSKWESG
jgi:hypothetical protein